MTDLLVAALAHSPGLTGFPDRAQADVAARALGAVDTLRSRIDAFEPDVVLGVSNDHFTSTSMRSLAPFALATGSTFDHPATARMSEFLQVPKGIVSGHPALAQQLLRDLLEDGVDITSMGGRLGFDENFSVPIHLLGLDGTPFVPLIVNAVQHPMPTPRRCVEVGRRLGEALRRQTLVDRVAVVATGGLSHSVGAPGAGSIDQDFDHAFLRMVTGGALDEVGQLDQDVISKAGNGAEEIRQWAVAAAVAAPDTFELIGYEPVPEWLSAVAVVCTRAPGGHARSAA